MCSCSFFKKNNVTSFDILLYIAMIFIYFKSDLTIIFKSNIYTLSNIILYYIILYYIILYYIVQRCILNCLISKFFVGKCNLFLFI